MLVFRSLIQEIKSYAKNYRTKNEIANKLSNNRGFMTSFAFHP